MTVYDYREITLKDDLCLEISRDTDIENPRENDCNAATFYYGPDDESSVDVPKQLVGFHYVVLKKKV